MPAKRLTSNRRFWNEKAVENPYWFVSSYGEFSAERDMESFWRSGNIIVSDVCARTKYTPEKSHVVAEIGCGVGRLTRAIAPKVAHVHAFDLSAKMLEIARSHELPNASFYVANGADLKPLSDNSCDLVLAYCVFQHLPSLEVLHAYLADMKRVAKPGAMIAFTTAPCDWKSSLMPLMRLRAFVREKLDPSGPKGIYKRDWVGIRPSVRQVRNLCPIPLKFEDMGDQRWLYWARA